MVPRKKDPETRLTAYKNNRIIYIGDAQKVTQWDELSPNQLKIAMYSAAQVRPDDTQQTRYTMPFKEFQELTGMDENSAGGKDYKRIFSEARKLSKLGVDFVAADGTLVGFNWLLGVQVSPKSGTVTYSIEDALLPFYKTRSGTFALIELADYMRLRGKYALLLYEFLAKWRAAGQVFQSIPALRVQLQVPDKKYPRIVDFLAWVIKPAVDEINEKATVAFNVKTAEKRGNHRKLEGITFYIKPLIKIDDEQAELLELLTECGVDAPVAAALINTYSRPRILGNVEYAKNYSWGPEKTVKSLPGLVCASIKNDYAHVEMIDLFEVEGETENITQEPCAFCGDTGIIKAKDGSFSTCSCRLPKPKAATAAKEIDEDREHWTGEGPDLVNEMFAGEK